MTDTLYRYRSMASDESIKYSLDIIDNSRLYCAAPASFNDPFECQAQISFDAPIELKTAQARKHILREKPGIGESQAQQLAAKRWQDIEKDRLSEFQNFLRNDIGVVSLSECNDDILMWSHYAGCHNGICIEFKCTHDSHADFIGQMQKVEYRNDLPQVNFYTTNKVDKAKAFVLTKAEHWSYEQEWRRIIVPERGNRFLSIPQDCISAIYLGCQLLPENCKMLKAHIDASIACRNIKLYQVIKKKHAYALSFELLK